MAWFTGGLITNPISGQILADTGALAAGSISGTLLAYSTVACLLTLHHRDSTNANDLHTQKIPLSTQNNAFQQVSIGNITLAANERITVSVDTGFTGQIQCSLLG